MAVARTAAMVGWKFSMKTVRTSLALSLPDGSVHGNDHTDGSSLQQRQSL